jgi:uncharacterized protein with ParB-like and HNH nuclease domain
MTEPIATAVTVIGRLNAVISAGIGSDIVIGKSKTSFLFESLNSPIAGLSKISILKRNIPALLKI